MAVYPNGTKSEPRITSNYGPRAPINTPGGTTSSFHTGVDYVGFSENKAVKAGTIVYAAYNASSGNEVIIDHGGGEFTRYFHNARFVRTGGMVAEGETIGIQGMTGMATGVHLHFRYDSPRGTHHDPRAYMQRILNGGGGSGGGGFETDPARVRRNAAYLNTLGLGPRSAAEDDGIPIDPPVTNTTVSKYYNLVQLWANSRGAWNDSYGPPYLNHTLEAEKALSAFLDAEASKNKRTVESTEVRRRQVTPGEAPSTSFGYDPAQNLLAGQEVTPDGWRKGEAVSGNDIWFKIGDTTVNGKPFELWAWAGAFTNKTASDLKDLTPVVTPPDPTPVGTKRTVKDNASVVVRDYPTTAGANLWAIAAGTEVEVLGYSKGTNVTMNGSTTDVWYKHSLGYSWAGGFTSQDTTGLTEITSQTPGTVLDPAQPWKNQTPDSSLAKWIGSPNYNRYPSNPDKDHITLHWMDGTLAGTDSHFQNPGEVINGRGTGAATNYGVGQTEIHQYILEKDYQHGDGNRESNTTGVSIEHEGGTTIPITKAVLDNSAKLVADVAKRNDMGELVWMTNVFPHSHWTPTTCPGTLDYAYIIREANLINGYGQPTDPGEPTDPEEPGVPLSQRVAELEAERDGLVDQLATQVAANDTVLALLQAEKDEVLRVKTAAQAAAQALSTI